MNKKIKDAVKRRDLIPWEKVRGCAFTSDEIRVLDARNKIKHMLREVKQQRKQRELTQEKLAELANLPRTTITKIETGYQNVSLKKIMQVAEAMDMRVEIKLVPMKPKV